MMGKTITAEQKNILMEFLEGNGNIARGKINSSFSTKESAMLWQKVAIKLNYCDGPKKTWKEWRKTWQDIKSTVKGRMAAIKAAETGEGPPTTLRLTNFYIRVKELLERIATRDPNEASESPVVLEDMGNTANDEGEIHETPPDICLTIPPIPTSTTQTYIFPVHPEFPFSCQPSHNHDYHNVTPSNEYHVLETPNPPTSSRPNLITRQNKPNKRRKIKPSRSVLVQMRGRLERTEEVARASQKIQEEQLKLKARVVQIKEDYYKRKLELLEEAVGALKSIANSLNKK